MIQIDDSTIKLYGSKFDLLAEYFALTDYMADIFNLSTEEFALSAYLSVTENKPELTKSKSNIFS